MGVELIANEDPLSFRVKADGLLDVFNEIDFGTGVADGGNENLSRRYLEIGDECLRPMSNIFKFPSFFKSRFSGLGWMKSFESLDAGHLVCTHDMASLFVQSTSLRIGVANGLYLGVENFSVFVLGIEPISGQVRLKVCFF